MVRARSAPPRRARGDRARGVGQPRRRPARLHAVGGEPATASPRADRRRHARDALARPALGRADRCRAPAARAMRMPSPDIWRRRAPTWPRSPTAAPASCASAPFRARPRALIPALAQDLRERAPRLALHVSESYFPEQLLDGLAAGELDLVDRARGRAARGPRVRGDHARPLRRCSCRPATRSLAARPPPDAGRPGRTRPDRQGLRHRQPACADGGARRLRCSASRASARTTCARCRRSCAAGSGIAVVPTLLLDEPEPTIARLPVDHLVPDRCIALTTRANGSRTPAVEFAAAIVRGLAS